MKQNMKYVVLFNEDIYDENTEHSRIDWRKIYSCSFEEKKSLIPFIHKLKMSENIFCQMSLVQDDNLQSLSLIKSPFVIFKSLFQIFENDEYESMAILLLIESVDPRSICSLLYNYISSSNLSNIKYLEYTIFTSFFLRSIITGEQVLDKLLLSYLGSEFIKNIEIFQ